MIGEEFRLRAVVLVRIRPEQTAVVSGNVEVFLRDAAGLAALINKGEQLVESGLEVILPVAVLWIATIEFLGDLLLEEFRL